MHPRSPLRPRLAVALLTAAAVLSVGAPSSAAPPSTETADKAAATKLLREGNQLLGEGEYLAALDKYRAAHARYASAKILLNIGTTLRQLGRNLEAAEAYEAYVKDPKAEPAKVKSAERILKEIEAVVARARIEVNEPGARVRLDGKEVKDFQSGLEIRVEAGEHTFVAEHDRFPPVVQTLTLAPHEHRTITLRLSPPEKVLVEGPQRTISWVVGGVGAAGLVAGGVAGALAVVKNQAAKAHCAGGDVCDQQGYDLGRAAKTSATVSTVSLAVGGAALVTGVILYFTAPRGAKPDPAAPKVGLAPTAGGLSLHLGGTF